jgi:hypothetical protein
MRTVRGTPECTLPHGRRFTARVTHSCEDADDAYIETTFVDVAPGRINILLRPNAGFTCVFSIHVTDEYRQAFPRIRALLSLISKRPFAVPPNDVSIHKTFMNVRIRGMFDTRFQIQFEESEIADAINQFGSLAETSFYIND